MPNRNVLLVEGASDQKFFKQLLSDISPNADIEPKIPRDVDAHIFRNGLQPLFQQLRLQTDQLIRGQIEKLGAVVDADFCEQENNGFTNRRQQLMELLTEKGFEIPDASSEIHTGEIFSHPTGAKIGIWIMPNHNNDGMIEDLFLNSIKPEQQPLLDYVKQSIDQLGDLKQFQSHRNSKAELATWLAWQADPGISPSYAYYKNLFDKNSVQFQALTNWLERVFA